MLTSAKRERIFEAMKDIYWTMQDSARQNAVDTCLEHGHNHGFDIHCDLYESTYAATLAMHRDCGANEYYDEDSDEYKKAKA